MSDHPVVPGNLGNIGRFSQPMTGYAPAASTPPPPVAGFTWYDGAYATRPAAGSANNDAFSGTDDFVMERDSGSAWVPWGPLLPLDEPPTTGWSWVNQGTATIDEAKGAFLFWVPATAVYSWRCRVRSMPTPPWTLTMGFVSTHLNTEGHASGIVLRDSNSGRIITWTEYWGSAVGTLARVQRWTNTTTHNANILDTRLIPLEPVFLRVVDDNVNFTYYWSVNGQDWVQVLQEARTAWLASPDEIGFTSQGTAVVARAMTLLSWEET